MTYGSNRKMHGICRAPINKDTASKWRGFVGQGSDAIMRDMPSRSEPEPPQRASAPWRFHRLRFGLRHAVFDADDGFIVGHAPIGCGPLLAAAPELLQALERVAQSETLAAARETATAAIETFVEREAMILADWKPDEEAPIL